MPSFRLLPSLTHPAQSSIHYCICLHGSQPPAPTEIVEPCLKDISGSAGTVHGQLDQGVGQAVDGKETNDGDHKQWTVLTPQVGEGGVGRDTVQVGAKTVIGVVLEGTDPAKEPPEGLLEDLLFIGVIIDPFPN